MFWGGGVPWAQKGSLRYGKKCFAVNRLLFWGVLGQNNQAKIKGSCEPTREHGALFLYLVDDGPGVICES